MKFSTSALALLTMASLVACGAKKEAPRAEPGPVVRDAKIETIQLSAVPEEYEAVGTVRAKSTATLSSKAMGVVVSIPVREGDRVRAGQLLVEVDVRDVQTQVDKAEAGSREARDALAEVDAALRAAEHGVEAARANRDLASSTYARFKTLAERDAVSRQEFDEVEARQKAASAELGRATEMRETLVAKRREVLAKMDQAKADIAGARVALGYSRIVAPVAGVIAAKLAEVGTLAAPGVPLITVEDDSRYRLEAAVDESQVAKIHQGSQARVRIDSLGDRDIPGRVEEIVPAADAATRSYTVKIGLERAPGLRSGFFGRALFPVGERKALLVPKSALLERGQLVGVLAIGNDQVARLRVVTTGKTVDQRVEVLSGLSAGERIVTVGAEKVADGARVE
jgi:multidrug efflux pump subunit AcrA (membrane-fusion protein)